MTNYQPVPANSAAPNEIASTPSSFSSSKMAVLLLGRLVVSSQIRIIYPFLPAISRGLGVPLETAALMVTIREFAALSSPLFGTLADRYGRKPLLLFGLLALAVGAAIVATAPTVGLVLGAFVLIGLCRASYDPASQAYVSDMVAYAQRGRMLGLLELSWSVAWLIGVPAAGLLIAAAGWRSVFMVLAGMGLVAALVVWRSLPSDREHQAMQNASRPLTTTWSTARKFTAPILALLAVTALVAMANANIMMIYGAWLESQYGLAVTGLGFISVAIAVAELVGEIASAGWVDRLGKRRALLGGIFVNALTFLLLPRMNFSIVAAIAGTTLVFLTSEFCIVSAFPLMSEIMPEARGAVMATNGAFVSIGIILISLVAPRVWAVGGLTANSLVSAAAVTIAGVLVWRSNVATELDGKHSHESLVTN